MKPLGHRSQGLRRIAMRARGAVLGCGEAAVFLSRSTGHAAAVAYTDRRYASAIRRHAAHLVGIYRDDLGENPGLTERLVEDLCEHARSGGAVTA